MQKLKLASSGFLNVTPTELTLDATLPCGQSFRWKKQSPGLWYGVLNRHFVALEQNAGENVVRFSSSHPNSEEAKRVLQDYFQLNYSLQNLYVEWGKSHSEDLKRPSMNAAFAEAGSRLPGIRLLRQDPHECFFSFICSQNNNIKRITQMIDKLTQEFGDHIVTIDGFKYHAFPTLDQMSKLTEDQLRDLGFGYRAKYIVTAVEQVKERGGEKWLHSLRTVQREEAQQKLIEIMGVGRKVADCIALFSLDKLDLVPVDTHVWQIAQRYMKSLSKASKSSSVTPIIYNEIGDFFRSRFGALAGWAHTILFAAELHEFKKIMSGEQNIHHKEEVLEKFKQEMEAAEKNAIAAKVEEITDRLVKVKEEPQDESEKDSKKRKRAAKVKKVEPKEEEEEEQKSPPLMDVKKEEEKEQENYFVSAADRVKQRKRHKPN